MIRVAIEGPHGTGKSSLIASLAQTLPGAVVAPEIVLEPFEEIIRRFGQGAFVLNDIARSAECSTTATYCLLDRCAASTYVYQLAEGGKDAAQLFLSVVGRMVRMGVLHVPTLVLVMTAEPALLEARLRKAGRDVSRDYLERQVEAYEQLIRDREAQAILGPIARIAVDSSSTIDDGAALALTLIQRNGGEPGGAKTDHQAAPAKGDSERGQVPSASIGK